jgi:Ca2+-binding EF-hand superfamily protein
MTKKAMLIGGIAVLALAVPAIAQMAKPDRPVQTRTEAEAKVRQHFAMIDADKDGFVTAQDMSAMRGAAMSKMFERMDTDKNGSISRAEFDAMHTGGNHRMGGGHDMKMGRSGGRIMMMADTDKDGRVALTEAVNGAMAMFDKADANKDGTLTAEERRAARQAMREAWRGKTTS